MTFSKSPTLRRKRGEKVGGDDAEINQRDRTSEVEKEEEVCVGVEMLETGCIW